ncbi:MAG: ARMT1-like domain-containing protein, partial [Anaerolineae bacterium]|nr:ARMT1-like domain-containing protein [Anaerolineae bacterium]
CVSAPGTILDLCSASFKKKYDTAPIIIAKGQANYETLSTAGTRVFCLLQVKCPVIGRDLGTPAGSYIIWQSHSQSLLTIGR